jgi:HPt (histidine-containing phosphotransfer) domain-containing protein
MNGLSRVEAAEECAPSVIDEDHLGRTTLGDRQLERQVLEIFVRQSTVMLGRVRCRQPDLVAMAAHTLNGSARGIGAWRVARAAEGLEYAVSEGVQPHLDAAVEELEAAVVEVNAAIGARLGPCSTD